MWDLPVIDLFTSKLTAVVPLYAALSRNDHTALFVDAFSRQWVYHLAWIFPPPTLMPRVLQHLNSATGTYIVVVPRWEKVFWRADLKSRAIAPPFQIHNLQANLVDMSTGRPPENTKPFRLEAWKIQGGLKRASAEEMRQAAFADNAPKPPDTGMRSNLVNNAQPLSFTGTPVFDSNV
nr:unnamed protein product [Callosobruchus analis]